MNDCNKLTAEYLLLSQISTDMGKTIFFVDDDKNILNLLEYTFQSRDGYHVKVFFTGEDCLANLSGGPDLIVLDHDFSKQGSSRMKGTDIMQKIRQVNPTVPVLVLSSQHEREILDNYIRQGATQIISKDDIFLDILMDSIRKLLR